MNRLTVDEIKDAFNASAAAVAMDWADHGIMDGLKALSYALADLRRGGIDVSFEAHAGLSEQAFSLMSGGVTMPVCGLLRIDHAYHMLGMAYKHEGKPCLKLALSQFDIRYQGVQGHLSQNGGITNFIRSHIYDLKKDPAALEEFQKFVILRSARNRILKSADVADAFDVSDRLIKPVLSMGKKG
jgi:hypothetical protein